MSLDDRDLQTRFRELRERDQAFAPSMAGVLSARPRARTTTVVAGTLTAVIAVTVIAALTLVNRRGGDAVTGSITTWSAPSDVLLRFGAPPAVNAMEVPGTSSLDALVPTTRSKSGASQ